MNPLKTARRLWNRRRKNAVKQSKISTRYMLKRIRKEIKKNPDLAEKIVVFSDSSHENLTHVYLGYEQVHLKQAGEFYFRLFKELQKCGFRVVEDLNYKKGFSGGQYWGELKGSRA